MSQFVDSLVSKMLPPMEEIKGIMRELNADKKISRIDEIQVYMARMNNEFNIISEMIGNLKKTIGIEQLQLSLKKVELNEFLLKCRDNFKKEFKAEDIIKRQLNVLSLESREILAKIIKEQLESIPIGTSEITSSVVAIIRKAKAAGLTGPHIDMLQIKTVLQRVIAAREIDVEFISLGLPVETIVSDEFEEIIKAMIGNAVNAYAKKVTIRVVNKSLEKVEVSIEDNGTGMGTYEKLFAFSPFFTTATYTKSFTLLRIKQVLNSYGGKISLFSEKNGMLKGTKFVIELPSMTGNEITVAEIMRLKRKLQTVLQAADQLTALPDIQESETRIITDFRQSAGNILKEIERYEIGDISFNSIMKNFKQWRGDFVTQYGILEEISEEKAAKINLKTSASEVMDIFLGILVSSFRSTENCLIMEVINEVADFYRPQFQTQKGNLILNFSGIEEAGLKDQKVFLSKTALRKILGDFLFAVHDRKVKNVVINVSVDNRQLKIEANIPEKTVFDANRFLLRQKENVAIANGLTKTAVLPNGGLNFSLWLPIKADMKTLPCRNFTFAMHPVIVISGDAGTNRGQAVEYSSAVLGGKTENIGFLKRVLVYYLIKEHQEWVAEINELAGRNEKEELNQLVENKIVPYVTDFLGEEPRVKIAKDPWMIRNASGEWIDSSAVGKRGQPPLRNRIKEETNRDEYMRFFYVFSNHIEIKKIIKAFSFDAGIKAVKAGKANCVIIKSTDLWVREKYQYDQSGIEFLNIFLHAPLAEKAKNIIYWDGEALLVRDGLKSDKDVSLQGKQEEADMSLLVTNKSGRQIGDIIIGYLISSGIILPTEFEQNHFSVKADYNKARVLLPESSI